MSKRTITTSEEFVGTYEAGQLLGRSADAVRQMVRTGKLKPAFETKHGRIYRRSDVEDLRKNLERK